MNLANFDSYNNNCRICNKPLTLLSEFEILISKDQYEFDLAGYIIYLFDGKRFNKTSKISTKGNSGVVNKIYNKMIKSFIINKRIFPNLSVRKLENSILPWSIDIIDMTLMKECVANDHRYYYATNSFFEFAPNSTHFLDVSSEILLSQDYRICNTIENNIVQGTSINDFSPGTNLWDANVTLPPVPMETWNISSRQEIKRRVDKLLLLK